MLKEIPQSCKNRVLLILREFILIIQLHQFFVTSRPCLLHVTVITLDLNTPSGTKIEI